MRRTTRRQIVNTVGQTKRRLLFMLLGLTIVLGYLNYRLPGNNFLDFFDKGQRDQIQLIHKEMYRVLEDYHIQDRWMELKDGWVFVRYPKKLRFIFLYSELIKKVESLGGEILECNEDMKTGRKRVVFGYHGDVVERFEFIPSDKIHGGPGKVAIIVDDFGNSLSDQIKEFIYTSQKITLSVIPGLLYSARVAHEAQKFGKEIMIHIPMEPLDQAPDSGPFTILTTLDKNEIMERTRRAILGVPFAVGINNHQGSKATQNSPAMSAFLNVVKSKGLFFVDSFTSRESVAFDLAKEMGIPCAKNMIFLDAEDDIDFITGQFERLSEMSTKRSKIIAIAHPRSKTLKVFKKVLPELEKRGINFVFASEIVN